MDRRPATIRDASAANRCVEALALRSATPVLTGFTSGEQTGACRKTRGTIACGLLLLAALGGAVPLAGQAPPSGEIYPGEWAWISGSQSSLSGTSGVYGTLGMPAGLANYPGSREGAVGWTDKSGNLWLFGGFGYANSTTFGYLNDIWEFNPSNNDWVWMGGSDTLSGNYGAAPPTYIPSAGAAYVPGGREGASSWTDNNGNLWLFGGLGEGAGVTACTGAGFDYLNDLWEFNPTAGEASTDQWAWLSGKCTPDAPGVYPATYGFASGIAPGARDYASTWTDKSGNLWLFGGEGYDADGNFGELNDLWEFNPVTTEWAWWGGSSTVPPYSGQPGTYGVMGTPATANIPGGRYGATSWKDSSGNLWLFGGVGFDGSGNSGSLNDLWEFNLSISNPVTGANGEWAWTGGSSAISGGGLPGVYGTELTPSVENLPGGRYEDVSWTDKNGNFWLFGGAGVGATAGSSGSLNDLWAFDPSTSQWVWMDGSSTVNQLGVYSPQYLPVADSIPGGRIEATSWTDVDGNLWFFGGNGTDGTINNDLWVYNPPPISFVGSPVPTPTFSVPSGTYATTQTVSISDTTPDATIYYTTDGTTPSFTGTVPNTGTSLYTGPITVSSTVPLTETLEAIATASGSTSAVGTAVYTIAPPAATPTFSPGAGPITSGQMVTISDTTPEALIFYTTNGTPPSFTGSVPNTGTNIYTGPITVSSPETIEAQATANGYSSSAVGIAVYTIASSGEAVVTDNETITVSDAETFPDVVDAEAITVTDSETVRAYNAIAITPSPTTFNASSGNGYATYAYSVPFTATGGIGTLTLTESGTLPAGLTFTGAALSGTPAVSSVGSTYTFSVTATDTDGDAVTVSGYSLTILAASAYPAVVTDNETITVSDAETFPDVVDSELITVTDVVNITTGPIITGPASLPAGIVGTQYQATTITASGGTVPYSWSATGLPPGLSISSSGVISGTPTASTGSPFAVSVNVLDSANATASMNYSLAVAASAPSVSCTIPTIYLSGDSGTAQITCTATDFTGTIALECNLPASLSKYIMCSFNPSSLNFASSSTASTTLTIQPVQSAFLERKFLPWVVQSGGVALGAVLWLPTWAFVMRRKKGILKRGILFLLILICGLPLISSCAGKAGPPTPPAGTYQASVVLTGPGLNQTITFTIQEP
jgi:N-acetylneuraminic acid mutarotase